MSKAPLFGETVERLSKAPVFGKAFESVFCDRSQKTFFGTGHKKTFAPFSRESDFERLEIMSDSPEMFFVTGHKRTFGI